MGDLELLGDRRADALAELGQLARLLGHDRVAERLGVDERAERAAVGDVDRQLADPRDLAPARRGGWRTTGTFSNVMRSQRPSRQSARDAHEPGGRLEHERR